MLKEKWRKRKGALKLKIKERFLKKRREQRRRENVLKKK